MSSAGSLVERARSRVSGARILVVLELVLASWWTQWDPGCPESGACPLVGEAGPRASASSLVCRAVSHSLRLQGPGSPGASAGALRDQSQVHSGGCSQVLEKLGT